MTITIRGPSYATEFIRKQTSPSGADLYRLSYNTDGIWCYPDAQGRHVDPMAVYRTIQGMQKVVPLGGLGAFEFLCTDLVLFAGDHPTAGTASAKAIPGCVIYAAIPDVELTDLTTHETTHALARALISSVELAGLRAILGDLYGSEDQEAAWQDRYSERLAEYVSASLWGQPIDQRMPSITTELLERVKAWAVDAIGQNEPADFLIDGHTVISMQVGSKDYKVNCEPRRMDAAPHQADDIRTMVPIRFVSEALGASVSWDQENKRAIISLVDNTIQLTIGSYVYTVNGEGRQMDVCPVLVDDARTFVPVRFVAEALGCEVDWDERTRTVTIVR